MVGNLLIMYFGIHQHASACLEWYLDQEDTRANDREMKKLMRREESVGLCRPPVPYMTLLTLIQYDAGSLTVS